MPGPESDTELLARSVREAGAIARRYYGGTYKSWQKSYGNPVTEAYIAIDTFLKTTLLAARPDYGWLSEETADDPARLGKTRVFVVDPIDGTVGFIKHRPQFTVVAAVVENRRPISGAIYNPITDEMYEGAEGSGARKNGTPIRVSAHAGLENMRLLAEKRVTDPNRWTKPWPSSLTTETRASVAYRMALVAEGAFDAMVSLTHKSDWDLAAADIILTEAGGCVTTRGGERLIYNREHPDHGSVICAGPVLQACLLERMKELRE